MAKIESTILDHLEWLGFVQPTGLVVSAHALVSAGAILDRRDAAGQELLKAAASAADDWTDAGPIIDDFTSFARTVLDWNWSPKGYAGTVAAPIPNELKLHLPEFDVTLEPTYAVRERDPVEGETAWQLLVSVVNLGVDLDEPMTERHFEASPHGRLERLLRSTGVPAGLITNGESLRLISAPKGESSGWLDFHVRDMVMPAGRPICAAMRLLLSQHRLLALPKDKRLAALLRDSRKFQNQVSERLAEQVLHALYELLRGIQAADSARGGDLLRDVLARDPDIVYRALLTVLLRLVFLLYAEERGMLPQDEAFLKYYSLTSLHERLREDAALYPDTMSQRFGAWAQLLVLFRMIYDGAETADLDLPPRHGELFDPNRFPFLEGRSSGTTGATFEVPLVPDGTIYRVLESLLVLDGERLSYRSLDVEQIGSIYETLMGFRLETTTGRSIAIRAQAKHGAPTAIDLEELLAARPNERKKWLDDRIDRKLTPRVLNEVKAAESITELHAAFEGVIDYRATPDLVPGGYLVLQPSDERRRSGSHYTPRELTEPIVQKALEPVLHRLAEGKPKGTEPEAILDLKVCDPAMGSGAFLVEACRQLGDALINAWDAYDQTPSVPPDEDIVVFARRLVAQRCLYGVDRNPVAVDLAKVSLWLITLAKEHSFTFLDHALRHGDSLVGLSLKQLKAFHWESTQNNLAGLKVDERIERARELRECIRTAPEDVNEEQLRSWWHEAEESLETVRLYGDLVVHAFFEASNQRTRRTKREEYAASVLAGTAGRHANRVQQARATDPSLAPFHWELEFPEVFARHPSGFDLFVGNPPFMGGVSISGSNVSNYLDWLLEMHPESHGNSDVVAHFFRRSYSLLRSRGAIGLIATNTIGQGDTRSTGLRWICTHGGEIYSVRKRVRWPGTAAVIVSVVHIAKGGVGVPRLLDNRVVDNITAFLFHSGGHENPVRLDGNSGKSFKGTMVYGMGFTFDDSDTRGVATPTSEMKRLIDENSANQEVIFPFISGEEVNASPTHAHHRYVINFGNRGEDECRSLWPDLMEIVEAKVRPERERLADNPDGRRRKAYWWQFGRSTPALDAAVQKIERVLVISSVGQHGTFAFLPSQMVFSHALIVFPLQSYAAFASLQSRPHELWARFFGSSMKDDLRYTPSDCFETFPFPEEWEARADLEEVGRKYYEYRAQLMIDNEEGLTKTYNRFHDPNESDPCIVQLRALHDEMDRAVLAAYGWDDIQPQAEFLLDYEIDEEEWGNRRRPYRYRWPDELHDEVLGRLLELNAVRAAQESAVTSSGSRRSGGFRAQGSRQDGMF